MKDTLAYPVYIQECEGCYCVSIPDLEQYTEGHTLNEAMMMAKDCISSLVIYYEDEGKEIPAPFSVDSSPEGNEKLYMIDADFRLKKMKP
ncbi:MAG: type II toxin-antitoxin system HicB family antitoxin [Lachnospiraceae bacterium]|nr:type II toxin-antitoxin system HicB family antitoxin [Lachnospiraceae bacterium]